MNLFIRIFEAFVITIAVELQCVCMSPCARRGARLCGCVCAFHFRTFHYTSRTTKSFYVLAQLGLANFKSATRHRAATAEKDRHHCLYLYRRFFPLHLNGDGQFVFFCARMRATNTHRITFDVFISICRVECENRVSLVCCSATNSSIY